MDDVLGEEKNMAMDVSMDGENLELVQQVSESRIVLTSLRHTVELMFGLKQKDPLLSSGTLAQLAKLKTKVHLLFLELKQLNRTVTFLGQTMKSGVQVKKISQTQVNLDFQGLLYERSHFIKEIYKCKDFKPAADDITLVSEPQFYALTLSPPISDKHSLMIARLQHEIKYRQQLLVELDAKRGRQAQHELSLAKQRDTSQDIRKHMKGVLGSVSKLASQLPGQALTVPISPSDAALLPKPLYTLYNILCCHQTYFQPGFKIKISHDNKEDNHSNNSNSNHKKKRSTTSMSMKEDSNLTITPHEASVVLTFALFPNGADKSEVSLLFRYLLPIGLVSVRASGPGAWPNMLINLYPQDDGETTPSNVSALGLSHIHIDTARFGTAFRWVQELCGLHFNHPNQSLTYLRFLNISTFIDELQKRAKMRASLRNQFHALKQKNGLSSLPPNMLDDLPQQPKLRISEFSPSSSTSFFKLKQNKNIDRDDQEDAQLEWFQTAAEYYQFVVHESKQTVILEGVVEITADYPNHPPTFRLTSHKDASEIEEEVNRFFPKTLRQISQSEEKGEAFLLSYQLKKILVCCELKARNSAALGEALRSDQSTPFVYETGRESKRT